MRSSFIFHEEWEDLFTASRLTYEEIGEMMIRAMQYAKTGEVPEYEDRTLAGVFAAIRKRIDYDAEQYERIVEARREAGRKGGLAKSSNAKQSQAKLSNAKQTLANPSKAKQTLANPSKSGNTDTDTNTDTVIDTSIYSLDYSPSQEQVSQYFKDKNYKADSKKFFEHYEAKRWYNGKKDWRILADEWELRDKPEPKPKIKKGLNYSQRQDSYDSLEELLLAR